MRISPPAPSPPTTCTPPPTRPVFKINKEKGGNRHEVVDLKVHIMLEGDVYESWSGFNHEILPTETQKNTCELVARCRSCGCLRSRSGAS